VTHAVHKVLKKLRDEGVLNKLSDGIAKRLANNDSLEALMSEDFLTAIIEKSAPRLKASLQKAPGSRRHLLKIVVDQLEQCRPMEGLTEAVSYALQVTLHTGRWHDVARSHPQRFVCRGRKRP
jgi:hypothetical protein